MPRFADWALDANLAVVAVVRSVAEHRGATAAQVALAWLRYRAQALGVVAVPIPGTRRAACIEENIGSLAVALTHDQLAAPDAAGTSVSGIRFEGMTWVSAGREQSLPRHAERMALARNVSDGLGVINGR